MSLTASVPGGSFIKASESFVNGPLKLKVTAAPAEFTPEDAKYANKNTGKSTRYTFTDKDGIDYIMDNSSKSMAQAFNTAGLELNDWIELNVTGSGMKTKWSVTKLAEGDLPF